jgi:DNA-binding XRE family transcriptional regulator
MTQTELAERTGLQRSHIVRLEQGRYGRWWHHSHIVRLEQGRYGATIDVLSSIADVLGKRVDFV